MKLSAKILKILAIITGLFCIPYGLLGFIGINPAGTHDELWIRLTGLYMSFLGILYIYPNSKIVKKTIIKNLYYIICISPIVVVYICAFVSIYKEGWDSFFAMRAGPETVISVFIFALFAPISLFLYEKQ